MSLMHAYRSLLEGGRPADAAMSIDPPAEALAQLVEFATDRGLLETTHPWELDPRTCRDLEQATGTEPAGGWARVAGLAAGAGVLHATPSGFQLLATADWVRESNDGFRRRMVEGFTCRLIPPAAAAALYVAMDVHPVWGLRLGRDVGSCDLPPRAVRFDDRGLDVVRRVVFGTLTGLLVALRALDDATAYPVDALGELLWWSAAGARTSVSAASAASTGIPVFVDSRMEERRMLTTRMAVVDLLDYVFVPAGVARRTDSGWFTVDPDALAAVRAGELDREDQEELFAMLCEVSGQAA